jgi:hypothetical protein
MSNHDSGQFLDRIVFTQDDPYDGEFCEPPDLPIGVPMASDVTDRYGWYVEVRVTRERTGISILSL